MSEFLRKGEGEKSERSGVCRVEACGQEKVETVLSVVALYFPL